MTVVAFDGKTMAADGLLNFDGRRTTGQKVFLRGRKLVGWCGPSMYAMALVEWAGRGARPGRYPHAEMAGLDDETPLVLVAAKSGLTLVGCHPRSIPIAEPRYAIGSGADFAIGAMDCGATAIEAVEVAINRSTSCRGPVQWLTLRGPL